MTNVSFVGSFHTTAKYPLPIWRESAKMLFNQTKEYDLVRQSGVYDKMIIECAFNNDLWKKKHPSVDGGCQDFEPSLTTNGMCYTFNGKHSSELWKVSEMTTAFASLFPSKTKNEKAFGGTRTNGILNKKYSKTLSYLGQDRKKCPPTTSDCKSVIFCLQQIAFCTVMKYLDPSCFFWHTNDTIFILKVQTILNNNFLSILVK